MFKSAFEGNRGEVERCLKDGVDINGFDRKNCTALHRAAFDGNLEAVRLLLAVGSDVNLAQPVEFLRSNGWTALMLAASAGATEIVEILIAAGAKPNIEGLGGIKAADAANAKGHAELAKMLKAAEQIAHIPGQKMKIPLEGHSGCRCSVRVDSVLALPRNIQVTGVLIDGERPSIGTRAVVRRTGAIGVIRSITSMEDILSQAKSVVVLKSGQSALPLQSYIGIKLEGISENEITSGDVITGT